MVTTVSSYARQMITAQYPLYLCIGAYRYVLADGDGGDAEGGNGDGGAAAMES